MDDETLSADIADERRATADLIEGLSDAQLDTPSLCGAWTVRDVAAHLLMPLVTSTPRFAWTMVRNRGNFNAASESLTAEVARRPTPEIAAGLRDRAARRFTPPGLGLEAPLTDLLIHGQDMRRPLGLTRDFDPDRLRVALDFMTGPKASRGFVPADRVRGLSWRTTDLDWSAGSGPEVTGPAEALLLAIAGRPVALPELSGPGLDTLAARLDG
ncbi:MAG: maleylpyruvate isomerase family mycothiol-dependent enzyme [Candidatus Nanopelagicales bacterium]